MRTENPVKSWIEDVCLVGQGEICCKYLLGDRDNPVCGKKYLPYSPPDDLTPHKDAKADNCEGIQNLASYEKTVQNLAELSTVFKAVHVSF